MLDKESAVVEVGETSVGVAGVKGFVGGFPDSALPDFGEPSLRRVYAETTDEVEGLARGLDEIAACDVRIALLHYAPTSATLEGEPPGIWAFLGSDRLRSRSRSTGPTSSSMATATWAGSRARSARSRSTTWLNP